MKTIFALPLLFLLTGCAAMVSEYAADKDGVPQRVRGVGIELFGNEKSQELAGDILNPHALRRMQVEDKHEMLFYLREVSANWTYDEAAQGLAVVDGMVIDIPEDDEPGSPESPDGVLPDNNPNGGDGGAGGVDGTAGG
jgi:hypothetical protein